MKHLKVSNKEAKQGFPWWLRLCASNTGGAVSIPHQGAKIPRNTQPKKIETKKKKKEPKQK